MVLVAGPLNSEQLQTLVILSFSKQTKAKTTKKKKVVPLILDTKIS